MANKRKQKKQVLANMTETPTKPEKTKKKSKAKSDKIQEAGEDEPVIVVNKVEESAPQ